MTEREEPENGAYLDDPYGIEGPENSSPITSIVLQIEIMAALGRWWK